MITYDDFKSFIEDGKNKGYLKEAVHTALFNTFLGLTPYTDESDFLRHIVTIGDLKQLLSTIHVSNSLELKNFLEQQKGFGNTWLKYFILWYLCDRASTYSLNGKITISLRKSGIQSSINPIMVFINSLTQILLNNSTVPQNPESENPGSTAVTLKEVTSASKEWEHWPRQIILWGAPGTGKSHSINEKIQTIRDLNPDNVVRVTFHPAMDYASFVGSYKPIMIGDNRDKIAYKFQPQPFLNAYQRAVTNPDQPVFLIIEEINRGNCAHIFGDVFQLLDRDGNLMSKYPVTPHEDIKTWLTTTNIENKDSLRLPSNLFIWATMNSSDQSLYKLDSAFQRRWKMIYTPINTKINDILIRIDNHTTVKWKDFLENINEKIAKECEDRRIGPFFIKGDNNEIRAEDFVGKVLNYLYRNVFGIYNIEGNPSEALSYDSFYNPGEPIFGENVINISKLKEFFNLIGCNVDDESCLETNSGEGIAEALDPVDQDGNHDSASNSYSEVAYQ